MIMSHQDFPGVKNTPDDIVSVWLYHDVATTAAQAFTWRTAEEQGYCPWCGREISRRYGNMNKHLRACPKKPRKA